VDRVCLQCGQTFKVVLYEIPRGGGKYCSRDCSATGNWTKDPVLREIRTLQSSITKAINKRSKELPE